MKQIVLLTTTIDSSSQPKGKEVVIDLEKLSENLHSEHGKPTKKQGYFHSAPANLGKLGRRKHGNQIRLNK